MNYIKLIFHSAIEDLFHEWKLSLCMILAVSSVLAPLLIIFGLKYGIVTSMRSQLIEDPVYRELKPLVSREYSQSFFDEMTQREDIAFVLPTVLPLSSLVLASANGVTQTMDVFPTAQGDTLLIENNAEVPDEGECVITGEASRIFLNLKDQQTLDIQVLRNRQGQQESVDLTCRIKAVLNDRASPLPQIYAPLSTVLDIERFKDGLSVESRGWQGNSREPTSTYDGILVFTKQNIDRVELSAMTINTGFTIAKPIEFNDAENLLGIKLTAQPYSIYELTTENSGISELSITTLKKNKLRGKSAIVIPYVRDINLQINSPMYENNSVVAINNEILSLSGLKMTLPEVKANQSIKDYFHFYNGDENAPETIDITTQSNENSLKMNLTGRSISGLQAQTLYIPVELAGVLNTIKEKAVIYSSASQQLEYDRLGYRGFRMFARSIDDVIPLSQTLRDREIEVATLSDDIIRVKTLDEGLTKMFLLIALITVLGGVFVVFVNMYASVERKRKDISIMRLMGMENKYVFLFPMTQAILLGMLSLLFAFMLYGLFETIVNRVFANSLINDSQICTLPAWSYLLTPIILMGIIVISTLSAGFKAMKIEPVEGMRYE